MIENKVSAVLDRRAASVTVGPAPLDAIRASAGRAQRRHKWTLGVGVTGAALVVAGLVLSLSWQGGESLPSDEFVASEPPAGHRWVGLGHAAVAVPDAWGTNVTGCGSPTADTVVIDPLPTAACLVGNVPKDVDSVTLTSRELDEESLRGWTSSRIGGYEAFTSPATSVPADTVTIHQRTVYVPDFKAVFEARSTTNLSVVDELLASITVLPDQVAVPGFQEDNLLYDEGDREVALNSYMSRLRALGLEGRREASGDSTTTGLVLIGDVRPVPGTMVTTGSKVDVGITVR